MNRYSTVDVKQSGLCTTKTPEDPVSLPVRVAMVPGKGRGILAIDDIASGDVIEAAPTARFPARDRKAIDTTSVFQWYFVSADPSDAMPQCDGLLVFGYSSLCNHSPTPNASVIWEKRETGDWATLLAIRDINANEEVTLFYTNIEDYAFAK